MPNPIRRLASRVLRTALSAAGRTIAPADMPQLVPGYVEQCIAGLRPALVLDIGANEGQFVHGLRQHGYTGPVVSFEPQPVPFQALAAAAAADPTWECHQTALGETPGEIEMHLSAFSQSSSLLPIGKRHVELMPFTAEIGTVQVPVARLDDLATTCNWGRESAFIKLDVQGFELSVIRGGKGIFGRAIGVLAELNFAPLFDGQSKYYEVMAALDAAGLRFVGLFGNYLDPASRDVQWGDGLFIRRN